jgi:ribokinase
MKGRVLVAGSVNMDVVARAARHPLPGETLAGETVAFLPGGKGANQAVAARRAGAETALLARLGADAFGESLRAFLKENGINTALTGTASGAATGTALIVVDGAAQNTIVVIPGANALLSPQDVAAADFSGFGVCVAQFEIPMETVIAAFRKARAAGAITLLNPSPSRIVPPELLDCTDILVVNETELAQQSGLETAPTEEAAILAAAEKIRAGRALRIVATLGRDGLVFLDEKGAGRISGRKVAAVDTTGAGDCFAGVLAAKIAAGVSFREALAMANIAASLSVQRHGAAPSMPQEADILDILRGEAA